MLEIRNKQTKKANEINLNPWDKPKCCQNQEASSPTLPDDTPSSSL